MSKSIRVQGARVHNLKNLSVEIPRDQLVVFTGLSGRASLRSPSTPSTPRASAATSRASRPTPASSSARWTSRTSTSSRDSRRRSRSTRRPRRATPARRSARSPRSTTTCACSSRASACRTARTAASRSPARPPSRSSTRSWIVPNGERFLVLATVVEGRKGEYSTLLNELAGQGFSRVRVDGVVMELRRARHARPRSLRAAHDRRRAGPPEREDDEPPASHRVGGGGAQAHQGRGQVPLPRSRRDWSSSPRRWPAATAGSASPSSRRATSPSTRPTARARSAPGLGTRFEVDPGPRRARRHLSLAEGALAPWAGRALQVLRATHRGDRRRSAASTSTRRGRSCKAKDKKLVLYGVDKRVGAGQVPQPLRQGAHLRDDLQRHRRVARAQAQRGRRRLVARAGRAVHARGRVHHLPRPAPASPRCSRCACTITTSPR